LTIPFLLIKNQAKGFYKGVGSPLVGVSAINSVLFFTWGRAQRYRYPMLVICSFSSDQFKPIRLFQPDKDIPLTISQLIGAGTITGTPLFTTTVYFVLFTYSIWLPHYRVVLYRLACGVCRGPRGLGKVQNAGPIRRRGSVQELL
jgi:hypothetical protein